MGKRVYTDEERKERKRVYEKARREANPNYDKERYQKNKEKILEQAKIRYLANPETAKARVKEWVKNNPEQRKAIANRWDKNNPEKRKAWLLSNPDKVSATKKKWKKANPEHVTVEQHKRRAREKGNGGELSKDIIQRLMVSQKGLCVYCHADLNEVKYHLDHIMPLAKGGRNDDENVQLLCPTCNLQKGAKDPIEFAQSKGLLV